eukprot:g8132.t1
MATAGPPQSFKPSAPGAPRAEPAERPTRRARSNVPIRARAREEREDSSPWLDSDVVPFGGQRWPSLGATISAQTRREENEYSGWQMPFPYELPSGEPCPVCALGECGDVNCPAYRPRRPEIRAQIEEAVLRHAAQRFANSGINTYVSVGAGLLAQDWMIIEKLRQQAAELQPSRVVFVDLQRAQPVIACEGKKLSAEEGGLDLAQLGFAGELGFEFSFSAVINFQGESCYGSRLFDFCNGEAQVAAAGAWIPNQPHSYLFTVSSTGVMRIYIDNQLAISQPGHPPERKVRTKLYLGRSSNSQVMFCGDMRKIQSQRALNQFARWFANDLSVYTFGSFASYAAAAAEDSRFQADLLLQIDLHEEIDGFDDLAKKVLSSQGMAMSLAAPGRSWRREGAKVVQFEVECEALTHLEMQKRQPWVFFGPGKSGRNHFCEEESREVMFSGNPHEVPVKQALLRTQLPTARSGSAQSAQRTLRCHKELEDDRVTELGLHRKELQTCETVDLAENKFTHEALRYILPYCLQFSGRVYEETTKRPRLEPSTFSELVEFGESCEHDDWIGSPPMPPMPSPEKMCSGLSSSDFTLDLEDLPPAKAPPKPSAVGSTGDWAFPPKPPVETQGSDLPGALPGAEALQAPNVASRCQLIPRKDVQMGVKLKHSQSQAREAMMAKVDELRAWQEYLEARKRFINLCDEWPDHEPEPKAATQPTEVYRRGFETESGSSYPRPK